MALNLCCESIMDGNKTGKEIYIYVVIIIFTIYFCNDYDTDNVSS